MNTIMATGNLGFGAGLAATQVGLCVGISATNIVLDCIIAAKNAGRAGTLAIYSYEQAIERVIFNAIGGASEFVQVLKNILDINHSCLASDTKDDGACEHNH